MNLPPYDICCHSSAASIMAMSRVSSLILLVASLFLNLREVSSQLEEIGCFIEGECLLSSFVGANETASSQECLGYCQVNHVNPNCPQFNKLI